MTTAAGGSTPDGTRKQEAPGMSRRGGSDPARGGARRGRLYEEAGVLVLALLFLVLPAYLRSTPGEGVHLQRRDVRPARIHVNRAPWYEWMLLPGIGEARARQIVEYREEHGEFKQIEDLLKVPRMPRGWVETAGEHLLLEGDAVEEG